MAAIADRYNENGHDSVNSCARDVMSGSIPRFLGTLNRMDGRVIYMTRQMCHHKNPKWPPKYHISSLNSCFDHLMQFVLNHRSTYGYVKAIQL